MMRFLSWGCGVQSTALGEMSAQGELPPLDAILTSDTRWERQATYDARDFYMERWRKIGMRVEIVRGGNTREQGANPKIHMPFWTGFGRGLLRRQCTRYFKLTPLKRRMRELAGYHATFPPHPPVASMEVWLGISLDEWPRANQSDVKFMVNRWPLLEKRMDRQDCREYLALRDLPVPPKSACIGCPYRHASEWSEMKAQAPEEFADAVMFDEEIRHNPLSGDGSNAEELFIYRHGVPLADADLDFDALRERRRYGTQLPMFACESGFCGT